MRAARGVVHEARVSDQFRHVHRIRQALERALRACGNADPAAVPRRVGIAWRVLREAVALALLHNAELVEADDLRFDEAEERLVQTHVDFLPGAAGVVSVVDGEHGRHGGERGGDGVGHRKARQRGRPVGKSRERRDSGERLRDRAVAAAPGIRARLTESGDAHHHEPGIDLREVRVAQAPPLERPRPVILDDDVGGARKFAEEFLPARLGKSQGDEPLVAPDHLPPQGLAVLHGRPVTHGVADAGHLDLDHVRAEIRELRGGERPGNHGAGIDDAKSA